MREIGTAPDRHLANHNQDKTQPDHTLPRLCLYFTLILPLFIIPISTTEGLEVTGHYMSLFQMWIEKKKNLILPGILHTGDEWPSLVSAGQSLVSATHTPVTQRSSTVLIVWKRRHVNVSAKLRHSHNAPLRGELRRKCLLRVPHE